MKGRVFDIQRFSVHDGPGIRTTVFMKGCPLSCQWCHNPEGISSEIQLQYVNEHCIGCHCCKQCGHGIHHFNGDTHELNREHCVMCGKCVKACPSKALMLKGEDYTSIDLLKVLLKDKAFYGEQGGVTFSGGEPLLQAAFVTQVLKHCKDNRLHTAIDTSGHVPWEQILETIPYCDLYLYDMKVYDRKIHKKYTGVNNDLILENLKKLDEIGKKLWIRIPIINGVNHTMEDMTKMADFLADLKNIKQVTLMPYHTLGMSKYKTLGMTLALKETGFIDDATCYKRQQIFIQKGFTVM